MNKNIREFHFQAVLPQGGVDVQFNYNWQQKKIVWMRVYPAEATGLPTDTMQLVSRDDKWGLQTEQTEIRMGQETSIVQFFANDTTDWIIDQIFKRLEEAGQVDNAYFE